MYSVREVQRALIALGYLPGGQGADDGRNGPATQRALKAFQVAKALSPDGKYGPATEEKLFGASAVKRPPDLDTGPQIIQPIPAVMPAGKPHWPLQRDCMTFYGSVGQHQKMLQLPYSMKIAWDKKTLVSRISVHEKVHDSAARAFAAIAKAYPTEEARAAIGIDIYGGSLNVRKMRGGSSWSMHSWGIAIDFDPERNTLHMGKDKAKLAQPAAVPFWEAWEAEGWVSLGRARNFDWMHVQAARL